MSRAFALMIPMAAASDAGAGFLSGTLVAALLLPHHRLLHKRDSAFAHRHPRPRLYQWGQATEQIWECRHQEEYG
ncbi:MAG: hypothetical protein WBE32_22515, partial [Pseudolabrys sp.]